MSRPDADLESYVRPPRRRLPVLGCLTMFLLLLALVVAGLAVAAKTRGGCGMISKALQSQTGLALTIGEARLGIPCDLVLNEVAIHPGQAPEGDFKAREVRIGWRRKGVILEVTGAQLDLVQAADGWMPDVFSRIAGLRDVRETAGLFADAPGRVRVSIRDSSIFWRGADREMKAFVQGLSFWSGVSDTPTATLRVYEVEALVVRREGRVDGRSIRRTWVSKDGVPYAEVSYKGVWDGDVRRIKDWWSVPEGH
jgi:hypothetical protein